MIDKITDWVSNNLIKAIIAPAAISGVSFFTNLSLALSDGEIDTTEFHKLMSGANGVQFLILLAVIIYLKRDKNDKNN